MAAPTTAVPTSERWRFRVLGRDDAPALQRLFDANPAYFVEIGGEPPRDDEALRELDDVPPAGMPYRALMLFGVVDAGQGGGDAAGGGELVAVATVVADFIAEGVWHIGLFLVATALHGSGAAQGIYDALERWIAAQGARWIRLGVVVGRDRAERFWRARGYRPVRERGPFAMGRKHNLLRVLVKPLADDDDDLARYLALVERDRPGAA